MGNPKGVRRDFTALEERRLRAARLLEKGVSQSQVARQVGVHRQSVSRWAQQLEKEGRTGLAQAGRAGRKPRLSAEDLERIERALKRGPEAFGYDTGLWTSARVADLIEKECGIDYTLDMSGACCGNSAGVANARPDELWNATKKPLPSGSENAGRRLKKSPKTRVRDRFRRRKRTEPETASLPNLGTARTNSRAAVPLQLENFVGHGRCNVVELLLPVVPGLDSQPAGRAVSETSPASSRLQAVGSLGRIPHASKPFGLGLCPGTKRTTLARISSRLRPGTKSG